MSTRSPLLLAAAVASCITADAFEERSGWGIGDDPACEPTDEHCWPEVDRASMAEVLNETGESVDAPDRGDRLRAVIGHARQTLGHKLNADEAELLDALDAYVAGQPTLSEDDAFAVAQSVRDGALGRLQHSMDDSYAAAVEDTFQRYGEGTACDGAAVACAQEGAAGPEDEVVIPSTYPQGVKDALEMLKHSGATGQAVAYMVIKTGALDLDYRRENARLFGEYDDDAPNYAYERNPDGSLKRGPDGQPIQKRDGNGQPIVESRGQYLAPTGLSPAARVERIVSRARLFAFGLGAGTSLVQDFLMNKMPGTRFATAAKAGRWATMVAGVTWEEFVLFEIHMKMALRIAEVYGWDVTESTALINVIWAVVMDGVWFNTAEIVATNMIIPFILREFGQTTLGRMIGEEALQRAAREAGARAAGKAVQGITQKMAERLSRSVYKDGLVAVIRGGFAILTRGASALISGAFDDWATRRLGHAIANSARVWLGDFLHTGELFMAHANKRRRVFRLYARMMVADGDQPSAAMQNGQFVNREMALMAAFLGHKYYSSDRTQDWIFDREMAEHAGILRQAWDERSDAQWAASFGDEAEINWWPEQERMVVLAMLWALLQADRYESTEELALYQSIRRVLEMPIIVPAGEMPVTAAEALNDQVLDRVQLSIKTEVDLTDPAVAVQYGLPTRHIIPMLEVPPANATGAEAERRTHLLQAQEALKRAFPAQ